MLRTMRILVLSSSVALIGCGTAQKYFPHTIGSSWVYEDQDRGEWIRRSTEGEEIGWDMYKVFSYEPALEDYNKSC